MIIYKQIDENRAEYDVSKYLTRKQRGNNRTHLKYAQ